MSLLEKIPLVCVTLTPVPLLWWLRCISHELIITHILLGGRGDWSNEGCSNATMNDELRDQDVVICKCNHLSTFGIFVVSYHGFYIVCINHMPYSNFLIQNTEPLECSPGFEPNPSLTACTGKLRQSSEFVL